MGQPLISVIIPVHNGARYLAEAITSVLAQTYRPIEIIVIDDGSTDESAHVVKSFAAVRYFFQPCQGAGAARNRGAEIAQGDYLSFLDADDLWVKDKLTWQIAAVAANPDLDMVFGFVRQFPSPELDFHIRASLSRGAELLPGQHVGTLLIKREAFFGVGPFATNWRVGEFIDWCARAMEKGLRSVMRPEVVMLRRLHANNMMIRERDASADYARILKASLDRRRGRIGDRRKTSIPPEADAG
jgi:glycosyltransferase involved in cell wall biosynthesis